MAKSEARKQAENMLKRARSLDDKARGDVVIWGGDFPADQLASFFDAWEEALAKLEWRMLEFASRFELQRVEGENKALPHDLTSLQRARLFGPSGDLDVRRDGDSFRWRFIGEQDGLPELAASFTPVDFWASHPDVTFRCASEEYYQWRGTGEEQRVNKSWLEQAGLPAEEVFLQQQHYLDQGTVAFVRYVGFKTKEQPHG